MSDGGGRELVRVGRSLGRDAAGGRVHNVLVGVATFALVTALVGVVAIFTTYGGRAERDGARNVVGVDAGGAHLWWSWQTSTIGGKYVDIVHVVPLDEDAPLPPGLESWPEPGEVVASPAVLADPAFDSWVSEVGTSRGATIGPEGLTDAGERLVYHRPAGDYDAATGVYLSGFGVSHGVDEGLLGSALRTKPLSVFLEMYTALVVLPVAILVLVAVRIDGNRRNQRLATLRTMGGSLRHRAAVVWGASALGVLAGLGTAVLLIALSLIFDVTMPLVDYSLRASDLRAATPWVVAATIAGVLVVLVALIVANSGKFSTATRDVAPKTTRVRPVLALLCPIVTWFSVMAYTQAISYGPNVTTLVYYVGILLTAGTLPFTVAGVTTLAARLLHERASKRGHAATIVATRQMLFDSRGVLKLSASLAVVILLAVQVQTLTGKLSAQAIEAATLQRETGNTILSVDLRGDTHMAEIHEVLEQHGQLLLYSGSPDYGDTTVRIAGSCEALTTAGLECVDGPASLQTMTRSARAVAGLAGGSSIDVTVADAFSKIESLPGGWWSSLALIASDDKPLDVTEINSELATIVTSPASVSPLSESWQVAANDDRAKAKWLGLFGWFTIALLALALGGASFSEHLDVARSARTWATLGANRRTVAVVNGWRILLPLALSVATGTGVAVWLAQPLLLPSQGGTLPSALVVGGATIAALIAVVFWGFATHLGVRELNRWAPRN